MEVSRSMAGKEYLNPLKVTINKNTSLIRTFDDNWQRQMQNRQELPLYCVNSPVPFAENEYRLYSPEEKLPLWLLLANNQRFSSFTATLGVLLTHDRRHTYVSALFFRRFTADPEQVYCRTINFPTLELIKPYISDALISEHKYWRTATPESLLILASTPEQEKTANLLRYF